METQFSNILKIHKLSWTQYNQEVANGTVDQTALYIRPNELLSIQVDSGTTTTYDGSVARSFNLASAGHTHGNITNVGKLGSASMVVVTDANKYITTSSTITTTELGYLNNVTSNIQTQLNGKLALSGGTMTGAGQIKNAHTGGSWISARDSALIRHTTYINSSSYSPILSCKTSVGEISNGIIHPEDRLVWSYTLDTDYNKGTNTNSVLMSLNTSGNLSANSFTANSDKRLKENIESYVCDKNILDLDIKKFDFINGPKNQIGCLAQDLQEICPELVTTGADGYLGIQESKIVYLLLDEVKKLKAEVATLAAQLNK